MSQARSEDRTPWTIDVVDLLRHPGDRRHLEVSAPVEGLAIESAAVVDDAEVALEVDLEALNGVEIVALGRLRAPWSGPCRRCLDEVAGTAEPAVREIFARDHEEGETYPLGEETIDLEPLVRDLVLLALPLAPLCRDDCPGPDPERFPAAVGGAEGEEDRPRDPRWAALDELRFDAELDAEDPDAQR